MISSDIETIAFWRPRYSLSFTISDRLLVCESELTSQNGLEPRGENGRRIRLSVLKI